TRAIRATGTPRPARRPRKASGGPATDSRSDSSSRTARSSENLFDPGEQLRGAEWLLQPTHARLPEKGPAGRGARAAGDDQEPRAGALAAADALTLTQDLRAAVADALAPHGYETVAASGPDAAAAMESTGASVAVLGRAAQMEGATVIAVGVYKAGSNTPASIVRVVGIGSAQLKSDLRAKVPKFVTTVLGLTPAVPEPKPVPGTLKMPVPVEPPPPPVQPRAQAQPVPGPQAQPRQPQLEPKQPAPPGEDALVSLIRETTADFVHVRGIRRKQNLKVQ